MKKEFLTDVSGEGYAHTSEFCQDIKDIISDINNQVTGAGDNTDWRSNLKKDPESGNIKNCLFNTRTILQYDPLLQGIKYNMLAGRIEPTLPLPWDRFSPYWTDDDDAQLINYLDKTYDCTFSDRCIRNALISVSHLGAFHPIKSYLESLPPWDRIKRLDTLLIDFLGAEDCEYSRAVSRITLCGAYYRVYSPGIKFDTATVLCGPQGIGKSTLVSKLAGPWYSDSLTISDMESKAAAEKLSGNWILELGELAGLKKAEVEKVKAFISRQTDKYRHSYGRHVESQPRQSILIGTTNSEHGYLRDTTGNRRFLPVRVSGNGKFKPWDLTQDDVDKIWAEVKEYCQNGESLVLPRHLISYAEHEQRQALESDDREGLVRDYLDRLLPDNWDSMDITARRQYLYGPDYPGKPVGRHKREHVCNLEIWSECFRREKESITRNDSSMISMIMMRFEDWAKDKSRKYIAPYGQQWTYHRI